MRKACCATAWMFCAGALAVLAGEIGRHEDVLKQSVAALEKINTALATVRDRETAEAARADLQKASAQWRSLQKQAEALPPPEKQEKDRLAKTYKPRFDDAVRKVRGEEARLQLIPGGRLALQEITGVLRNAER